VSTDAGGPDAQNRGEATPALRLIRITKRFPGVVANRDVSLDVLPEEIHGLLGENGAGKTTLMNIVSGLMQPDAGHIEVDGKPVSIGSALDARRLGIGMVHQHFMLVPTMTVAENIALGEHRGGLPLARLAKVSARLREVSRRYGLAVDPSARISDLSVGERQRVEIVRLLFRGSDILILDEPTAVLTPHEWRDLAEVMRRLAGEGKAIVFITHKLDELLAVSNRCTVMRDGAVVGTLDVGDTDKTMLARMMVGRDVALRVERTPTNAGAPLVAVENVDLVAEDGRKLLDGISFEVRGGEILGLAGVDGNGQQELVQVLTGLASPSSGSLSFGGKVLTHLSPRAFKRLGGGVIHADRHRDSVALGLSIEDNLMMSDIDDPRFSRRGWIRLDAVRETAARLMREHDVRAPDARVLMRQLSGGNQQKVVLAREMDRRPKLLIAAQPTRGLDVGAVEFVYQRLFEHKARGGGVLLISTELEEVLSLSDRIAVIAGGRILGNFDADNADVETIGLLMGHEAGIHT
jgi:simple sugar transport system ATP-binding protein